MYPVVIALSLAAGYVARKFYEDVKEPIDAQGFRVYGRFAPAQLVAAFTPNQANSGPNNPTGSMATAVMLMKGSKTGLDRPLTVGVIYPDPSIPGGAWFKGSIAVQAQGGGMTLAPQSFVAGEVMALGVPTGPGTYNWITKYQ